MAKLEERNEVEKIYDDLQLRLINKRLDKIRREKDRPLATDTFLSEAMARYSPEPFDRGRRYGYRRPYRVDPLEEIPVIHPSTVLMTPSPNVYLPYQQQTLAPLPPQPQHSPAPNTKAELMEMIMLQGAQMHQAVMHQMMLSSIPKPSTTPPLPPLMPNLPSNTIVSQAPTDKDREPQVPLSFAKDILKGRLSNRQVRTGDDWNKSWDRRAILEQRRYQPTWDIPDPELRRAESEKMIPISFARELIFQKPHVAQQEGRATPDEFADIHSLPDGRGTPLLQHRASQRSIPMYMHSATGRRGYSAVSNKGKQEKNDVEVQTSDDASYPELKLPFPGPYPLRRFRQAAFAVQACLRLANGVTKAQHEIDFLFGIHIKEICEAVKIKYLEPSGALMERLRTLTKDDSVDFAEKLNSGSKKEKKKIFNDIISSVQDCVDAVVSVMPECGVLGVKNRSSVYQILQEGNIFPSGYFWKQEMELIDLDEEGRTKRIDERTATVLLLGLLVSRGLVMKVLLQPSTLPLRHKVVKDSNADNNLKLMATLLIELTRMVYNNKRNKNQHVDRPEEVEDLIYSQTQISEFLEAKKKAMEKEGARLRKWSQEYFKQICTFNK